MPDLNQASEMQDDAISAVVNDVADEAAIEAVEDTVDYKAEAKRLQAIIDGGNEHQKKLLNEAKAAKDAARQAKQDADDLALKNGEFEKLYKQTKSELEAEKAERQNEKSSYRMKSLEIEANKIARDLADGDNVELLSDFVLKSLERLSDQNGSLSEDILRDVASEFEQNKKFKALLKTSKATGGGAIGGTTTVPTVDTNNMSATDRLEAYHAGRFKK